MKTILLSGLWNLRGRRQASSCEEEITLKASVPGYAALALSESGYLPNDLYMGENIKEAEKYDDYEWWYETSFTAPEERKNVFLVFEGVDCIAEYYLNGILFGTSENMLIAHEFDVSTYLKDGENMLTVHLKSATLANNDADYTVYSIMTWGHADETALRRAPHTYGWDIMPQAISAGIWRDVKLEVRDEIAFSQLYFRTDEYSCDAIFEIKCHLCEMDGIEIEFFGNCGDNSDFYEKLPINGRKCGKKRLNIKNPKKWWPYGYGEANVYDVTARIYKNGNIIHETHSSFGLRSVILDRSESTDGVNGKFRFIINGHEIMCKGSNWVPMDAYHSNDKKRYAKAFELARDIGCNILRCWGGNVYEDHEFYDFCDRAGIMVWQDFSMACRICPENDKFKKLLRKEAEFIVRKLRSHPSIILWSGDNEVDQILASFTHPSVNSLTREILPNVIRLNDIGRPYLPSSPYFSDEVYEGWNRGKRPPENHLWGPRDYYKSDYYKNDKSHFISECGYHGCPSMESIKKFITPEKVWPYQNNSEWILHSTDQCGNDSRVMLMEKQIRQLFGDVPSDPENYIIASQISQAEADKYFIERMRLRRPLGSGIIWWNLLDGWPQMSDAVVDYYYEKKLAYGYIKRSQAPFTIAFREVENWRIELFACNDTLKERNGSFTVKDAEDGSILMQGNFKAGMNRNTSLGKLDLFYSDKKMLIAEWEVDGVGGFNHYLAGYPPFNLRKYKDLMEKWNLNA